MGSGLRNESEGNPNGIINEGGLHASRHFDSNDCNPISAQDSSDGLRLSYPNNRHPMNAFGGSSGSFFTFEQPELQTNMQDCSVPGGSIKGGGSIPFPVAPDNVFYINCENEYGEYHELETSFQTDYEDSKQNGNHILSITKLQNQETGNCALFIPLLFKWLIPFILKLTNVVSFSGSSHVLPLENFDPNSGMHDSINSSALPDSALENGNMHSSSMYSYRDPDAAVPYIVKPETEIFEASNATYDGSNSCVILPRYSTSDAEIGLPQVVSAQFQQGYPCEVKLHTREESPDSSLADVSVTDLDALLPDELCTEYDQSDDMSLMSESSTDSSPIHSSRNSTSDHVDRDFVNASKQLVPGSDATWPSKPKSYFKDETIDQLLQRAHTQRDVLKSCESAVKKYPSRSSITVEDDVDICILDDISDPARPPRVPLRAKPHLISQRPEFSESRYHGVGGMGLLPDDERLTFRLALQVSLTIIYCYCR